jgi:hypothetical protein
MVMWAFIAGSMSMLVGIVFGVVIADATKRVHRPVDDVVAPYNPNYKETQR